MFYPLSVLLRGTPHHMAPEVSAHKGAVAKLAAAIAPGSPFLWSPLDLQQPSSPSHHPTVVQEVPTIPQLLQQHLPFLA